MLPPAIPVLTDEKYANCTPDTIVPPGCTLPERMTKKLEKKDDQEEK